MQPGMNYYGMMPDSYNLIVNTEHPVVKKILTQAHAAVDADLLAVVNEISDKEGQIKPLEDEKYKAKAGEFAQDKQDLLKALQDDVKALKEKESAEISSSTSLSSKVECSRAKLSQHSSAAHSNCFN